jgi:hypothetical protein
MLCLLFLCVKAVTRKTYKDEAAVGNFGIGLRFLEIESLKRLYTNTGGWGGGDTVMI